MRIDDFLHFQLVEECHSHSEHLAVLCKECTVLEAKQSNTNAIDGTVCQRNFWSFSLPLTASGKNPDL